MERKRDTVRWRGVAMSDGVEAALGREKLVDNASWAEANLTVLKKKKIHTVDSVATIGQ
jgi:hypothetical protein